MSEHDIGRSHSERPDPSSLTVEQWWKITSAWDLSSRSFAYRARALPSAERSRRSDELLETSRTFKTEDARKFAAHIAAIYSLADQALDNAIRSFRVSPRNFLLKVRKPFR